MIRSFVGLNVRYPPYPLLFIARDLHHTSSCPIDQVSTCRDGINDARRLELTNLGNNFAIHRL